MLDLQFCVSHFTSRPGILQPVERLVYEMNNWGIGFDSGQQQEILLFFTESRLPMGPKQPLVQWILGALYLGLSGWGMKLTTYLHILLRLHIHQSVRPHNLKFLILGA
jgi:hypothetical protein